VHNHVIAVIGSVRSGIKDANAVVQNAGKGRRKACCPATGVGGIANQRATVELRLGENSPADACGVADQRTIVKTATLRSAALNIGPVALGLLNLTNDIGPVNVQGNVTGSAGSQWTKDGLGTLTLAGAASTVPDLQIRKGGLAVNGVLSGALSISNGAVLSGN